MEVSALAVASALRVASEGASDESALALLERPVALAEEDFAAVDFAVVERPVV
jgi:hypothetical protein